MCIACSMRPGSDVLSGYDQHSGGFSATAGSTDLPYYTIDQIAGYLTDGYWAYTGGSSFAFELDASRTITYDISLLSKEAQKIATEALASWASVTGIKFQNVGKTATIVNEIGDFRDTNPTVNGGSYTKINSNTIINGTIDDSLDKDYIGIYLQSGQTYSMSIANEGLVSRLDPILSLYDSNGNIIIESDNNIFPSGSEVIRYSVNQSGIYYISVAHSDKAELGYIEPSKYELSIKNAAQIMFEETDRYGAYASSDVIENKIQHSYINILDSWNSVGDNNLGLSMYIHEIGHALGLGHAGPYNGSATWPNDALYSNDSYSMSVMSYFDQDDNPNDPNEYGQPVTIMPADIVAIQNLYGAGTAGFQTGNTIWGPGGNAGGYTQYLFDKSVGLIQDDFVVFDQYVLTVYDTGGIDTLTGSMFGNDQVINLNQLTHSTIGSLVGNVAIARGTVIENAIGGDGNDTITGNGVANTLSGGNGADTIYGGEGNDTIWGSSSAVSPDDGNDTIYGESGDDTINGNGGNDTIYSGTGNDDVSGGAGNDIIHGGAGADRMRGGGGNDTIWGSSSLTDTGDGNDTIFGDHGNDTINGNGGNDTLYGGTGTDNVSGGAGNDTIYGGQGSGDTGDGGDLLYGNLGNDTIYGSSGDDRIFGGDGNDILYGNADADRFVFNTALNAKTNFDQIKDFTVNKDKIELSQAIFAGIGTVLNSNEFQSGTNGLADSASDRIIYNKNTGQLFYDSNGSTSGGQTLFATVTAGTVLTISDFVMIA